MDLAISSNETQGTCHPSEVPVYQLLTTIVTENCHKWRVLGPVRCSTARLNGVSVFRWVTFTKLT